MSCSFGAIAPDLRVPNYQPGQAQDLPKTRVPQSCELQDYLPNDELGVQPGSPYSWLGSKNWTRGEYKGGSSQCYQNTPLPPMFPRQARWGGSPLGGWWPTSPNYLSGVLLKPANWCPSSFYKYDDLAPWGLKSR